MSRPPHDIIDHLLTHLMEEAAELQKACAKAIRFGPHHLWKKENQLNIEAMAEELADIDWLVEELKSYGLNITNAPPKNRREKYLAALHLSKQLGRLR